MRNQSGSGGEKGTRLLHPCVTDYGAPLTSALAQLSEIEGFRARWSDGEIGVVEEVALVIRCGHEGQRLRIVPLDVLDERRRKPSS